MMICALLSFPNGFLVGTLIVPMFDLLYETCTKNASVYVSE